MYFLPFLHLIFSTFLTFLYFTLFRLFECGQSSTFNLHKNQILRTLDCACFRAYVCVNKSYAIYIFYMTHPQRVAPCSIVLYLQYGVTRCCILRSVISVIRIIFLSCLHGVNMVQTPYKHRVCIVLIVKLYYCSTVFNSSEASKLNFEHLNQNATPLPSLLSTKLDQNHHFLYH